MSSHDGVTVTIILSIDGNSPVRSATPIPSIATNTMASGGKSRKLRSALVNIQRTLSESSRLSTVMDLAGSRGSTTDHPICEPTTLNSSTAAPRMTNNVAGSGKRFPTRSISASTRAIERFTTEFARVI